MFAFWLVLIIVSFCAILFFVFELPGVVFQRRVHFKRIKDIVIIVGITISIVVFYMALAFAFSYVEDTLLRYPICGSILAFGVIYISGTILPLQKTDYSKVNIVRHILKELLPYMIIYVAAFYILLEFVFISLMILIVGSILITIRIYFVTKSYRIAQANQKAEQAQEERINNNPND